MAVDDVLVAVEDRHRRDPGRVGAGGVRLGQREARRQLASQQRPQPALLLFVGRADGQQFAVAGVGRLIAEDVRGRRCPAEDLVHQGELDLAESLSAELRIEVGGP